VFLVQAASRIGRHTTSAFDWFQALTHPWFLTLKPGRSNAWKMSLSFYLLSYSSR